MGITCVVNYKLSCLQVILILKVFKKINKCVYTYVCVCGLNKMHFTFFI